MGLYRVFFCVLTLQFLGEEALLIQSSVKVIKSLIKYCSPKNRTHIFLNNMSLMELINHLSVIVRSLWGVCYY